MVKLIRNLLSLRPSGSSQFSLIGKTDNKHGSHSCNKSFTDQRFHALDNSKRSTVVASSSDQLSGPVGWDGSSVVLVGYRPHPPPAADDQLYVCTTNHDSNGTADTSFKLSSGNASPNYEAASIAAASQRDGRLTSCDSADSAVASCILAYNEEIVPAASFAGATADDVESPRSRNNSDNNFPSPPPSFISSSKSPTQLDDEFRQSSPKSALKQQSPRELFRFPEAISSIIPPQQLRHHHMDLTDSFDRLSAGRRFPAGNVDLKRRTSSIQPFPSAFRVLLESGETRSFRYDSTTTVNDILGQIQEKLGIAVIQHFGFVLRRANEVVFVLPETMKISEFVDWCAANEYEAALRVVFPPKQPEDFLLVDPVAFDYLYTQCTNDVLSGRFEGELGADKAIYLSALHILQFAVASNLSGKLTTRRIDKEFGLEHFIPAWVRERGRGRSVDNAVSESLRHLTERQRGAGQQNYKMQYVKLLSLLSEYGAHAFPAILLGFTEERCSLLVGPCCGISYLPASLPQTKPVFLIRFEHIRCIELHWSGSSPTNITCSVHHVVKDITPIQFLLPRWLKDSFLFVLRRYRRLLVSNSSEVNVIETSDQSSAAGGVVVVGDSIPVASSSSQPLATSASNSPFSHSKPSSSTLTNNQLQTPSSNSSKLPERKVNLQKFSSTVRHNTKSPRQALLHLHIGQSSGTNQPQNSKFHSPRTTDEGSMRHSLLTESISCPNIREMSSTAADSTQRTTSSVPHHRREAESGIGSEMESPRSHLPAMISPPSSSSDGGCANSSAADLLLEMRFEPPPGFGDSDESEEASTNFVLDNPLHCDARTAPSPAPRNLTSEVSSPDSCTCTANRTRSIDDIVVSFNMALQGTLGEDVTGAWSPVMMTADHPSLAGAITSCDNVVTVAVDEDLPPPPPELNETTLTLDSTGYPPSECAPPPPPPYPEALLVPSFDNVGASSESGTDDAMIGTTPSNLETQMSPLPAPVLMAINNVPSDQLRSTITRILLNRSQPMDVDAQLQTIISDGSALRFSLSVFGTQDISSSHDAEIQAINLSCLDDLSDKLVNCCRAMLASIGRSNKSVFAGLASDAMLAFAETARFLLDSHYSNNGTTSLQRIGQLSIGLTSAMDAYNCCLQTGLAVIEEQSLEMPDQIEADSMVFNEKLRQLLLNAAWLARSLAVFASLTLQVKQDAAAGAGELMSSVVDANNHPITPPSSNEPDSNIEATSAL